MAACTLGLDDDARFWALGARRQPSQVVALSAAAADETGSPLPTAALAKANCC